MLNSKEVSTNKISTFVLSLIYLVLALSAVAIFVALGAYYQGEPIETTLSMLAIGFLTLALAGYILFQSRRRIANLKIETLPILTTIECRKCNIKTTREFQRGDYVFKELEPCPKCQNEKQLITAIYREVKEKEKNPVI
ncbi:MAG: hypothetical protein N3D85_06990 [Candidatus Bathyarchaeota archaeon]|nr:hypothetical protein [Candidatus Bathyarchaeota archaeon]